MSRGRIIVAGSLAQRPGYGGHAWVFLQYLLGFRRLGYDVLFLDRLDATMCWDRSGRPCAAEDSWNLQYLANVMRRAGLTDAWSLDCDQGARTLGLARATVLEKARDAVLLDVMGFLADEEIFARPRQRVFVDIDPGFGQMWHDLGLAKIFGRHDAYVTIGENIGQPDCMIPTCGLKWITSPQPIVPDEWPPAEEVAGGPFTSIASWRGPFGPVEYAGRIYGLRVHEFRKFVTLPRVTGQRFDLALDIDPGESRDLALLRENGWNLLDPSAVVSGTDRYRSFIQRSKAELMIAKNMYVQSRSGWFSDRSICYLASGRPVLAQDTGFTGLYPIGQGLLAFTTLDEAGAGIAEISGNYALHCRAARGIAEEHFASDKVLTRLLEKIG